MTRYYLARVTAGKVSMRLNGGRWDSASITIYRRPDKGWWIFRYDCYLWDSLVRSSLARWIPRDDYPMSVKLAAYMLLVRLQGGTDMSIETLDYID